MAPQLKLVKPSTDAEKATRTTADTLEVTPAVVRSWKLPPFQRALKMNDKLLTGLCRCSRTDGLRERRWDSEGEAKGIGHAIIAMSDRKASVTVQPLRASMPPKKKKAAPPLTVVDLFCGAGGLSLGLKRAEWRVLCSIDHFDAAVATYRRNLGDHVRGEAIDIETELPSSTMIVGGPPCQGFSSAGLRRVGDSRNTLVSVYAQLIAKHKPAAFIFENVEGFLTAENGDRVLELLTPLVAAGYRIHMRKLNAANYGAPQHRKRVVAIGGLGWSPTFPEATHRAYGAPGAELIASDRRAAPTIMDALAGLREPSASMPGTPQGHWCTPLDEDDLKRVRHLKAGQTMRDLPEDLWHESYKRRAFRRVMDGTPSERRGGAPCGIRRLRPNEPSKAITGGARSEFVHPKADRYLTIRECARIQTFPDDFEFVGTTAEQSLLIGNAVPPVLGEAIGRSLAAQLSNAKIGALPGALLSFVPTTSTGMSPALQRISAAVAAEFGQEGLADLQLRLWA